MALRPKTIQIINRLAYPIMFEKNPLDSIDWEMEEIVPALLSFASKAEILDALEEASIETGWIDQIASNRNHSEDAMKQFLAAVRSRLIQ
jgi:hypothetical protein